MTEQLALLGGAPVRTTPWPAWPVYDEREEQALQEVLHSGVWGVSGGEGRATAFERVFAKAHDAAYAQTVYNGSAALLVSLHALGIDYGAEVIVPAYTFMATATACLLAGVMPVFVDVEPDTYTMDPAALEAAITPRTQAVIPVHIAGLPADMDRILDVARRHGLAVIEDACQAHGAAWKGRRVGALGDLGCFSFQSSKNINAGEGGAIVTDRQDLAERVWSVHNCGRVRDGKWYQHEVLGSNFRMTEWQAAILLAQLTRFEEMGKLREANATYLAERLLAETPLRPLARDPRVTQHGYHIFIARYDPVAFGDLDRATFLKALQAEGVPCSEGYVPLYQMAAVRDGSARLRRAMGTPELPEPQCPVTERACATEGIWFFQTMLLGTQADMDSIVEAVSKVARLAETLPLGSGRV
mgnify:CR=1 FL=1